MLLASSSWSSERTKKNRLVFWHLPRDAGGGDVAKRYFNVADERSLMGVTKRISKYSVVKYTFNKLVTCMIEGLFDEHSGHSSREFLHNIITLRVSQCI